MARILIIEDNEPLLELMAYLLEAFGHRVAGAADGAAGLEKAFRHRPDLILCDLQLPTLDGYELMQRLKRDPRTRQVPIVAVTALAMLRDRGGALAAGFDGYLAKPIDPETFADAVAIFLRVAGEGGAAAEPSAWQRSS